MSSLAIMRGLDVTADTCEGIGLLGLPTERSAKRRLAGSADEVVRTIGTILDEMIEGAIEKRTAADFKAAVTEAMPRYVQLVMSAGRIVSAIVPRETLARLSSESLSELEADIREHGLTSFGADMCNRGVFTVWTLRKISDLVEQLEKADATAVESETDAKFTRSFFVHALRARFHIDCLTASMRTRRALYPEVLPLINDGLRSAVDAYAWIKQAVDLRFPSDESQDVPEYWSADDSALLDSSMRDLGTAESD